jgi:hypothetical protein
VDSTLTVVTAWMTRTREVTYKTIMLIIDKMATFVTTRSMVVLRIAVMGQL